MSMLFFVIALLLSAQVFFCQFYRKVSKSVEMLIYKTKCTLTQIWTSTVGLIWVLTLNSITYLLMASSKNGPPEEFLGKSVLKICCKFTRKHSCRSVISIKLLFNFTEIALPRGSSPLNMLHIFRTSLYKNTYGVPLIQIFCRCIPLAKLSHVHFFFFLQGEIYLASLFTSSIFFLWIYLTLVFCNYWI